MRRWGLVLALLLSLGVNVGILATLATQRAREETTAPLPAPPPPPPFDRRPDDGPAARPGPGGPQRRLQRLVEEMRLEGEEKRRFLAIQRRFFETSREERRVLAELHRELRQELLAPAPRRARIDALVEQIGRSYAKLEGAMAANVVDSRAVLDGDQERLFLEFVRRLRAGQGRRFPPGRRPLRP